MVQNDLSIISSDVIKIKLEEFFVKRFKCDDVKITVESGSKHGDNFIGIVYRVTGERNKQCNSLSNVNQDNEPGKLSIILKVAPANKMRREKFFSRVCFLREIFVYDEILKTFRELQETNGIIPEENGFHQIPECYSFLDDDGHETLFFEDLRDNKFEMIDIRNEPITIEIAQIVFETLGKFHALSFSLKDKQPEKFQKLVEQIPEVLLTEGKNGLREYFQSFKPMICGVLRDDEEDKRKKIENLFEKSFFDVSSKYVNGNDAEPYAVICHGDCWSNNFLYQFDENRKPKDIRLLDWQITRYASPIADLAYFIFSGTSKEFRDKHLDSLLNLYHSRLSDMLTRLGCDPEQLFPYKAFQDQWKKFGGFGLPMAAMLLPILTSSNAVVPDLDEMSEQEEMKAWSNPLENDVYVERMRGVIQDVVELGLI